jgi:predicted GNAT family acetyltransferase
MYGATFRAYVGRACGCHRIGRTSAAHGGVAMTVQVTRNDDTARYEAQIDGVLAGFAQYQLTDDLIVFTHTEVDRTFEGQGVGSAIARAALDDVRASGQRKVLPLCPFISGWIGKHRDYVDLVYGAPRSTATD